MASIKQGEVYSYPYLFEWQQARGETAGRKSRPVCVVVPMARAGVTHLFLLAISGSEPRQGQTAIAIPETELRRANLEARERGWIIVSECNYDIAERSFYFDAAQAPLGRFGEAFTAIIKARFREAISAKRLRRVDRDLA